MLREMSGYNRVFMSYLDSCRRRKGWQRLPETSSLRETYAVRDIVFTAENMFTVVSKIHDTWACVAFCSCGEVRIFTYILGEYLCAQLKNRWEITKHTFFLANGSG